MRGSHVIACAAGFVAAGASLGDIIVRSGTAADAAGLAATVDQFRADVNNGGGLNAPGAEAPSPGVGRREINWDAPALDAFASPNLMPNDFFNRVSKRGATFSTGGDGFLVSQRDPGGNLGNPALRFGDINAQYNTEFKAFSQQRLFAVKGSTEMDVHFAIPTFPTAAAAVMGFGAVFCDVDLETSTFMEFYDAGDHLLARQFVAVRDKGLSFLGVSFTAGELVSRVHIVTGNTDLGAGFSDGPNDAGAIRDVVAMDDFVYGEPVPTPGTLALAGAAILACPRRRR